MLQKSCLLPQFPGQQLLQQSLKNEMTDAKYKKAFDSVLQVARRNGVYKTFVDFDLDMIVGTMDGLQLLPRQAIRKIYSSL